MTIAATTATAAAMIEIAHRKTSELIPYDRNARTHGDEQITQIAASIVEFGFTNPLLVGADGVIIAGHDNCGLDSHGGSDD